MTTKKQNQEILKVLEEKIDKIKVKKILGNLQSIPKDKICSLDLKKLDLKKFHARQEMKDAIEELKHLGVTKEYLREHFIMASLIMGGLL